MRSVGCRLWLVDLNHWLTFSNICHGLTVIYHQGRVLVIHQRSFSVSNVVIIDLIRRPDHR